VSGSIDYFLALSSPWTYLAGPRFKDLVARNGLRVTYKPYNIMHVFGLNGTKPVGQRPKPVQSNRLRELARWRDHLGMPLNLHPAHFPVDPTRAGHVLIAAQLAGTDQDKMIDLADGYLRACWAEERDLGDEATLVAIANEQGLDGAALLKAADGGEAGAVFQANTDEAIDIEVFGSPTWVCDGEIFWGQDRLDFVTRFVEGKA
jgi:2-hydroxychromene-2-carboxylate isomerase